MCTVTFSPRKHGYALVMNRDEKLTRPTGRPPAEIVINGRRVVAPSEPGGGTWISVSDIGVAFALINWYSIPAWVGGKPVSRGEVVRAVGSCTTAALAAKNLELLPLKYINPFRLIGIFPAPNEILEWRWDFKKLTHKKHHWKLQQWISSGFNEPEAQRIRGKAFREATRQKSAGSLEWLRRLHRSHAPIIGPFSTCMHRADAATVSYTEIIVSSRITTTRYLDESPCHCARGRLQARTLKLI
jgi:Transport and Golgi organisation 2